VLNDVPVPSEDPPVNAAYQLIVPAEAAAPKVTDPVPQRDADVVPVMVGTALTVTETDPGTVLTPSKTDTLYVILEIGLSVGLAMVDEKPGGVDDQV
jgi:hypothetical protein